MYLSKRLTHEHHDFGKVKSNGSGGGICTWVDIPIPLLTPCIVTAQTVKVKTRVHSKPGTPSTRPTPVPTNSGNMMRATKVDSEPPQARNAALIAKRARCIPLHCTHSTKLALVKAKD